MKPKAVAVFGAGIAGLALAISLRTRGYDCRVYERRSGQDGGGMGFILSAQALADLDELGVAWPAKSPGTSVHRFHRYDPTGVLGGTEDMPAGWRGVRRADVVEALRGLLPATAVEYDAGLAALSVDGRGTVKHAVLTNGERYGRTSTWRQTARGPGPGGRSSRCRPSGRPRCRSSWAWSATLA